MAEAEVKRYPISEFFEAPQGEGDWRGQMMLFVRFAGCTVGKPISNGADDPFKKDHPEVKVTAHGILPIWQEMCTTADGRQFLCDTDFRKKLSLSVKEILSLLPKGWLHICLTGGEPMIHDLGEIVGAAGIDVTVHIETSGTVPADRAFRRGFQQLENYVEDGFVHLTVSPKLGVREDIVKIADELKLLVDDKFRWDAWPKFVTNHPHIWLQPINDTYELNQANVARVIQLMHDHPNCRISDQGHKIWKTR